MKVHNKYRVRGDKKDMFDPSIIKGRQTTIELALAQETGTVAHSYLLHPQHFDY
ncbi:hypothetical protein [Pseudomonas sp. FP2338]|uniref:hypothetical protein n=1 Tax=Pseudomonas sp. FP2338 TaxID=2954093 RepID=UPI002736C516|nr:hypothetical protein [Pseudomonas sp. FP2338]WLH87804.1 hypothetical protein PSH96_00820 [Pseudomonas sp. FP2338]